MAYITTPDLVDRFSGQEILQLGWPGGKYRYLGRSASASDLPTDWPSAVADDVALAEAEAAFYRYDGSNWKALATDRIDSVIADAGATIDSYLSPRYSLPLDQALIDASPLPRIAGDLVRYRLMKDLPPEEVRDRYRDAIAWLKDVQAGRASLGGQDTAVATGEGRVVTATGKSNIDWETY